jgi:transaldolase/glucose-6-phosphate isomerase
MSVAAQVNERLAALTEAGTSVWLDQIRRGLIEDGELERMVREDSLRGVTANPAIFEKAILGSTDYDEELAQLAREGLETREIYRRLAVGDVQGAADVLRPVWEETNGGDGFVSLEVAPRLAHDTEGTLEQARLYWELLDRPNVMIKIPGTPEGMPAIEQATFEGINVNVTLLFAVEAYEQAAEAYIRGLERRRDAGEGLAVHSVASFFVSRVDAEVDRRLEALGRTDLQGKAAVANARKAYHLFKQRFHGERFAALREAGAPVQRPLWASTGVKNPAYPDTKYVDELVGPETVNTMPLPTLLAFGERGKVSGPTAEADFRADLDALAEAGVDMADVTGKLLGDGVDAFMESMSKLLNGIESRREGVVLGRPVTIESSLPAEFERPVAERARRAAEEDVTHRIWAKDESLWGGPGEPEIGNRLGWLTVGEQMLEAVPELEDFRRECAAEGLTDAVLLGMGGSSLAPEVIRQSFAEPGDGALRLHVLDSTDAGAVLAVERRIEPERTLFVVSTKSGGTIETLSLFGYFHSRVPNGRNFAAITDPGSSLVELAEQQGFRRIFLNDPDIGGRYSALSYFGLVPAALMGVDVGALLDRAQVAEQNCESLSDNSGLWLGLTMGELAQRGRDKLTFAVSPPIESFGLWVEQLVAESTGKQGKGILPVADEPLAAPAAYGDDRVFAYLRSAEEPDAELEDWARALARAGQPVVTVPVEGLEDLGRAFFFAEFATAVAGWALGINPFDQPDVQEAKDNTARVLDGYLRSGKLPAIADATPEDLKGMLSQVGPPKYVAIMGYVQPSDEFDAAAAELRRAIRERTRCATTFGYGPRFLHSTGQLHKGGPPTGVFLQLVHDGGGDVEVPGAGYSFDTLKNAQAIGDLETLRGHGLPAERVRLEGEPAAALRRLTDRIKEML